MISNLELLNFCKLNDFYVNVKKIDGVNGCTVEYPARSSIHPLTSTYNKAYTLDGEGIHFRGDEDDKANFLKCPSYCRRVLVFNDIYLQCQTIDIKPAIISWNVKEDEEYVEKKCLDDILDQPDMSADVVLEEHFAELYYMYYKNPFNNYTRLAYDFGVEEGYKILTSKNND